MTRPPGQSSWSRSGCTSSTRRVICSTRTGVWTHIRIPLEAEEDERWTFPISGRVIQRRRSEILEPQRFPPSVVEDLRSRSLIYAGQYQQRPAPADGNLIKRSEVRFYGGIDPKTGQPDEMLPEYFDFKLISVDCAFKDSANSDFVAIIVIGVKGRKRYVLNIVNSHLDAAATEAEIKRLWETHRPIHAVLVEDRANGPAVIQFLRRTLPGVIAINPQGGKAGRMFAVAAAWQSGDWIVDRRALGPNSSLTKSPLSRMGKMTTCAMRCRKPQAGYCRGRLRPSRLAMPLPGGRCSSTRRLKCSNSLWNRMRQAIYLFLL